MTLNITRPRFDSTIRGGAIGSKERLAKSLPFLHTIAAAR